jgi:hypothetical protein
MKYRFVTSPDGEKMKVIRPANAERALSLAHEALRTQDSEIFLTLPSVVQDYTFRGYLAKDARTEQAVVVNAKGKFLEHLQPGDSFVTGSLEAKDAAS